MKHYDNPLDYLLAMAALVGATVFWSRNGWRAVHRGTYTALYVSPLWLALRLKEDL
jgi:hypothetical protein